MRPLEGTRANFAMLRSSLSKRGLTTKPPSRNWRKNTRTNDADHRVVHRSRCRVEAETWWRQRILGERALKGNKRECWRKKDWIESGESAFARKKLTLLRQYRQEKLKSELGRKPMKRNLQKLRADQEGRLLALLNAWTTGYNKIWLSA